MNRADMTYMKMSLDGFSSCWILPKYVLLSLSWKCFIIFWKFWAKSVPFCTFIVFKLASRLEEPSSAWATHQMVGANKPNSFDSLPPAEIFVEQPSLLKTMGQSSIYNAKIFSSSWKGSLQALKYSGGFTGDYSLVPGATSNKTP